jgi:hypothetical protein
LLNRDGTAATPEEAPAPSKKGVLMTGGRADASWKRRVFDAAIKEGENR